MKKSKKIISISYTSFFLFFYFFNPVLFPLKKIDSEQEYSQFFTQAEKFRLNGEFEKSIEFFEKSLSIAKKIADKEKQCDSFLKLGLLNWNLGQLKDSSIKYKQALFLAQKLNLKNKKEECQNALEIYRLYNDGKKFRSSGKHLKSIESFEKAIDLARESGSKEHKLKCIRQMSFTYEDQNKLKKFKSLNEEALNIAQHLSHKKEEERCLINIGNYYFNLNNYSEALNCYEQALVIIRNIKNRPDESICLNNIGATYQHVGDFDKALEYLEKALEIDEESEDDHYISMVINNIGTTFRTKGLIYKNKEDFYEALDYFNKCRKLTRITEDKKTEIRVLNNIGTVYTDLENYNEALKYFQTGYEIAEEIKDTEAMGMILTNIGYVHYNQGDYEESTKYYEKAINLASEIEQGQILWEAYLENAKAYEKQDRFNEALENYRESINTIEKIRSGIMLEEFKASYLGTDKRINAYHHLINLLINLHQSESGNSYDLEAFNCLEKAKARAFLDSLELSQINIYQGVDPKLINEEKELMKDITNIYSKLLAAELTSEDKISLREKLEEYENKLEVLKRKMRTKIPAYTNLFYPEIITLEEAQKRLLDSKTAFFAYCIGNENSYAFVITKKDLRIFSIPARDNIQRQVSDYLKIINNKENQNFYLGYELFSKLVHPGLDKNIRNIIFIPDDILHFLPFEALITHREKNNWLIKDYKIAYAPSISSLREIIQRKKSNNKNPRMDILAFGDPNFGKLETEEDGGDIFQDFFSSRAYNFFRLNFSGLEIDRISALFKKTKRKIFRREEAREEQLIGHNLEDYKIIHFATHSIIDDKKPARSSIVLSLYDDSTEDGFLQMREIYNLKLNSDLVTLSSCQTGLGEFFRGEGIEGINRAFFYAGASSVIMSLWAINDQASYQLMERFYTHLRSSNSIMNALRKAKLEMIDSDVLSHPYYWAGFISSGKADEVIFPRSTYKWFFFGAFFLLAGGLILALRKSLRKK